MDDRADVSTQLAYKCPKCGNDFPVTQAACDVCGFVCDRDQCRTIAVSKEGF